MLVKKIIKFLSLISIVFGASLACSLPSFFHENKQELVEKHIPQNFEKERQDIYNSYPNVETIDAKLCFSNVHSGYVNISLDEQTKSCTIISVDNLVMQYETLTIYSPFKMNGREYAINKIENYSFQDTVFNESESACELRFGQSDNSSLSIGSFAFYNIGIAEVTFDRFQHISYIGEQAFGGNLITNIYDGSGGGSPDNKKYLMVRFESTFNYCVVEKTLSTDRTFTWSNKAKIVGGLFPYNVLTIPDVDDFDSLCDDFLVGSSSLTEVQFASNNITTIGRGAFRNCPNLKKITFLGSDNHFVLKQFATENDWMLISKENYDLGIYIPAAGLAYGNIELPSTTDIVEDFSFENSGITKIILPDTITRIGVKAFYGCRQAVNITIKSAKLDWIGEFAFANCTSLESIVIPGNTETIPEGCFYNNTLLMNFAIPNECKKIEYQAFYNCVSLKSITLPKNFETILPSAFANCYLIERITIQNSSSVVKLFSLDVFLMDQSLRTIGLPRDIIKHYQKDMYWGVLEELFVVDGRPLTIPGIVMVVLLGTFNAALLAVTIPMFIILRKGSKSAKAKKALTKWIILFWVACGVDVLLIVSTILVCILI